MLEDSSFGDEETSSVSAHKAVDSKNSAWPGEHRVPHLSMFRKHGNDPKTSSVVHSLYGAYSLTTMHRTLGHSLVTLNGAQLRADLSQGLWLLSSLWEPHLYYRHKHGQYRQGCYSPPQSTPDPITVIMVSSVGRMATTAPSTSSECHLIKAMILFLSQQQHKYLHSGPLLTIHHHWMVISDNNFLLFPAVEPEQGKAPAPDDYLVVT